MDDPTVPADTRRIDPCDIAAVAATVLTANGHDGKEYYLTGEEHFTIANRSRSSQQPSGAISTYAGRHPRAGRGVPISQRRARCPRTPPPSSKVHPDAPGTRPDFAPTRSNVCSAAGLERSPTGAQRNIDVFRPDRATANSLTVPQPTRSLRCRRAVRSESAAPALRGAVKDRVTRYMKP